MGHGEVDSSTPRCIYSAAQHKKGRLPSPATDLTEQKRAAAVTPYFEEVNMCRYCANRLFFPPTRFVRLIAGSPDADVRVKITRRLTEKGKRGLFRGCKRMTRHRCEIRDARSVLPIRVLAARSLLPSERAAERGIRTNRKS